MISQQETRHDHFVEAAGTDGGPAAAHRESHQRAHEVKYPLSAVPHHLVRSLPFGQLRVFEAGPVLDRPLIPCGSSLGTALANMR